MEGKIIRSFISEQQCNVIQCLRLMSDNKKKINQLLYYIREYKNALGFSCNSDCIKSVIRDNLKSIRETLKEYEAEQRRHKYRVKMYSRGIAMARFVRTKKKHGKEDTRYVNKKG